jgi:hypothetical protein
LAIAVMVVVVFVVISNNLINYFNLLKYQYLLFLIIMAFLIGTQIICIIFIVFIIFVNVNVIVIVFIVFIVVVFIDFIMFIYSSIYLPILMLMTLFIDKNQEVTVNIHYQN